MTMQSAIDVSSRTRAIFLQPGAATQANATSADPATQPEHAPQPSGTEARAAGVVILRCADVWELASGWW